MLDKLLQSPTLKQALRLADQSHSLVIEELWDSTKACLISLLAEHLKQDVLLITPQDVHESHLYYDIKGLTNHGIFELPTLDLSNAGLKTNSDILGERQNTLKQLLQHDRPKILISSLQNLYQKLPSPEQLIKSSFHLEVGTRISIEDLLVHLETFEYSRFAQLQDKGEFALRGNILDIFPANSPDPFRIEFFDDEIESIRRFDPHSQKSIERIEAFTFFPAHHEAKEKTPSASLLDYLDKNALIVLDVPEVLEEKMIQLESYFQAHKQFFFSSEKIFESIHSRQLLFFTQHPLHTLTTIEKPIEIEANALSYDFSFFSQQFRAVRYFPPFAKLEHTFTPPEFSGNDLDGYSLLNFILQSHELPNLDFCFAFSDNTEKKYLIKKLENQALALPEKTLEITQYFSKGFFVKDLKLVCFSSVDLSHRYKLRRQKLRSTFHFSAPEIKEFHPGDIVVHYQNGIGKFLGMVKKKDHLNQEVDFFHIQYADNASMFVPLTQAYLLSKYIGVQQSSPSLHKLGTNKWKKQLQQTESALLGYAADLLEIQAKRELKGAFSLPEDSQEVIDFETDFPYEPTQDQQNAFDEVKKDLQSNTNMDRLICGDVGFGKTEVALRAAFKMVADGQKQVAIMVPTTILAVQHYETFVKRMQNYPVNIALLSRLQKSAQTRKTIEDLQEGKIDILIGTHRLASDDVIFSDLGMLIIDEEQKFGVRVKEKLRKLKAQLHCLTLSATPIPRTLYSALTGVKTMSLIQTPPQDRLPIKSFIVEKDYQGIKEAICTELNRDGQVFYIHNRVETIYKEADHLQKLVPQAKIIVAHGQLSAAQIEDTFHQFKQKQADILVATTLIESGIDIPLANTILIDKAQNYGLADLYQLRGRVGRWNRPAYAYFLISKSQALQEIASKRLQALLDSSSYGGGMKIAMHDLEIRGAGDLLGLEQSGHVFNVGFQLYCRLLRQTIDSLQGKPIKALYHTKIESPFPAKIPHTYVENSSLRLELYQRIGEAESLSIIDQLHEEIRDRFGPEPIELNWLMAISKIRLIASQKNILSLKLKAFTLSVEKKVGKNRTSTQNFMTGKLKNPTELEEKILSILKQV